MALVGEVIPKLTPKSANNNFKTYIGTKIVKAEPMDHLTFIATVRQEPVSSMQENAHGYKVEYDDGYVSWSPKEVFERHYREVTKEEKKIIG